MAARTAITVAATRLTDFMCASSTRLRDDVDQHGLAGLDGGDALAESVGEVVGVLDRPDAHRAIAERDLGVIDVRIVDRDADRRIAYTAIVPIRHALDVHELLMIGAVILDDR